MSLNVYITAVRPTTVFDANITHNLNKMAMAVSTDFYKAVWHPEDLDIEYTYQLENYLLDGLTKLKSNPDYYKTFEPKNKWGTYDGFIGWLEKYLEACQLNPDGKIEVSR